MLYISRMYGQRRYVVTDTDDNTDEEVSLDKLRRAVMAGVEIMGVTAVTHAGVKYVMKAEVYQLPSEMTAKQAKAKTLKGIDIRTKDGVITYINWNDATVPTNCRLRLSDYGTEVADNVLNECRNAHTKEIVIVLDDKVTIRRYSFSNSQQCSVRFDMTELRSDKTARIIYLEWVEDRLEFKTLSNFVIDRADRADKWLAYGVVKRGFEPGRWFSDETMSWVENIFYRQFKTLSETKFQFPQTQEALAVARDYCVHLKRKAAFWLSEPDDYDEVFTADKFNVFKALEIATTCNRAVVLDFSNYVYYLHTSDRIRQLYVNLAVRANKWFLNLMVQQGWEMLF